MDIKRNNRRFELVSPYIPTGDQPQAINKLTNGLKNGEKSQILLGATGTGKTFTIANVINNNNKPTLIIAHNKTLASQLYNELKSFFPNNAVEYFVSYYDFYQPEAYIPSTDTYIEKDSSINDEINKLRNRATNKLLERNDTIIVASVSSIFGLGNPEEYKKHIINLRNNTEYDRDDLINNLVENQYIRNDIDFQRGTFRVRGDIIDIFPTSYENSIIRVEFFGDSIDKIFEINPINGKILNSIESIFIFPANHFMIDKMHLYQAIKKIKKDLKNRIKELKSLGKLLEANRLQQRITYDLEMLQETGYTSGIENYSRYFDGRVSGQPPYTLLDFFPKNFLIIIDESHVTMPQIKGMFNSDFSRKKKLVDYGFRLPSALDNRPLKLSEFENYVHQIIYMSATPGDYEKNQTSCIVEQIIRPTGLLDPCVEVRSTHNQIDDLVKEIYKRIDQKERVFITTLTKKMAEDLTDYLKDLEIKVQYLHSDIKTLERAKIIHDLRLGKFDVLVGINLLREGIDIPEVSLICILDADKEGFLRNERSLIQTIGRASRNVHGHVIMYADRMTDSMNLAIKETNRRREIQHRYNIENSIVPKTINKKINSIFTSNDDLNIKNQKDYKKSYFNKLNESDQNRIIKDLQLQMKQAARNLNFEKAAYLRDVILDLKP